MTRRVEVATVCVVDDGERLLWRVVATGLGPRAAWLRAMALRLDGRRARVALEVA